MVSHPLGDVVKGLEPLYSQSSSFLAFSKSGSGKGVSSHFVAHFGQTLNNYQELGALKEGIFYDEKGNRCRNCRSVCA